jgi:hypothetical protein
MTTFYSIVVEGTDFVLFFHHFYLKVQGGKKLNNLFITRLICKNHESTPDLCSFLIDQYSKHGSLGFELPSETNSLQYSRDFKLD